MKYQKSAVLPKERWCYHACLLLEQLFGSSALRPLRRVLERRLERRLAGTESPCKEPVDRRENLSPEEFREEYFRKGRPVIFSGAALSWPCVKEWSLDYFAEHLGEKDVLLVEAPGLTTRKECNGFEFLAIRELVLGIRRGEEKYLRFSPLLHQNASLAQALDLSWFEKMRGKRSFAKTYYLFAGGKGQRTYLHNDQPCNLFVQVSGKKKWTLFPVQDSALLYPEVASTAYVRSAVNLSNPDLQRHPLQRLARPFEAFLKAGDVLYVPPFLWHEVENLSETIAVGYRFSSLGAAWNSSAAFLFLRALSTNPPLWKTICYGKIDTNLIWAHAGGFLREVLAEKRKRARTHEAES